MNESSKPAAGAMVMAIGDNGTELCPIGETETIRAIAVGSNNEVIPASLRALRRRVGEGIPLRLITVLRPGTRRNPGPFARVDFRCTPFERYRLDSGPVMGDFSSCCLRSIDDALDPLWSELTEKDRCRLVRGIAGGNASK